MIAEPELGIWNLGSERLIPVLTISDRLLPNHGELWT
jgi:hypothetical protein